MKILFASAEVAPFSKAGGLADVVGSLPKCLEDDAEIAIFTPFHGLIDADKYGIKELENSEMWLTFGNQGHKFRLFMCKLPDTNINVFFVHNDWYFTCFKEVYPKWLDTRYEHERYIAFSLAVLEYAKALNFRADVIHANDWHTAMIPVYLHSNYRYDDFWKNTKCVFEIHNLAYQGVWFEDVLDFANMRKDIVYNEWGVEHYGKVNWMKGAINYSDRIVAVSPNYAREILTGEYGEGMDYTLRMNQSKLVGILNGIDYSVFNPKTDKNLAANYTYRTLDKKQENKKAVCDFFGLKYNPERPLIAFISRLVEQKGLDLGQMDEYKPAAKGHAIEAGHFQKLGIGGFKALQHIVVKDGQHHQKGNEYRQLGGAKPDQAQDHIGSHGYGFDGEHKGPEEQFHIPAAARQDTQAGAQEKGQEKASGDTQQAKGNGL